jgi:calpain-7
MSSSRVLQVGLTLWAQDVELKIEKSNTKQEALDTAIAATELYMKALRQASSEADKARISRKCNQLIVKAEEIKKASTWPPQNSDAFSRVPVSERRLSKHEELIILEGSRLHGFIFPPWTSEPDDSVFKPASVDAPVYR